MPYGSCRSSRLSNACRAFGARTFRRFRKDTRGSVMIYIGLTLPILLGISGLAVDGSIWFANKRSMQATADAAAFSAALEMTRVNDDALAKSRAMADAQDNQYNPSTGDTIQVNSPPLYGPYSGNNAAFEAIVSRPSPSFLSRMIHGEQVTVSARAVAIVANPGGTPCVLALDSFMQDAIKINNGTMKAGGCRVQANSRNAWALHNYSGGVLDADKINLVGGYENDGYMSSTPETGYLPVPDPFAGIPKPPVGTCDYTDLSFSNGYHYLTEGTYCGGISVSGKAQVEFGPGTYVIDGGALKATGNQASLTGSDVTFYTNGSSTIDIAGNGVVNLAAPQTGNYAGILFYGDPDAPSTTSHTVTGNATMLYEGYMYFRTAELKVNGNGNGESSTYVGAIARTIRFGGNGEMLFSYDPTDPNVPIIAGGSTVTMVE
jgi:Flp pilus assembly protein TadG